jgi:hypothetical protein
MQAVIGKCLITAVILPEWMKKDCTKSWGLKSQVGI